METFNAEWSNQTKEVVDNIQDSTVSWEDLEQISVSLGKTSATHYCVTSQVRKSKCNPR